MSDTSDSLSDTLQVFPDDSTALDVHVEPVRNSIREHVKGMKPQTKEKILIAALTEYARGEASVPLNQRIRRILREDATCHVDSWLG